SGVSGRGFLNQGTNTTVNSAHSVFIGAGGGATFSTNATGTYTMNGGTLLVGSAAGDVLALGAGTGGFGTFIQNAGFVSVFNLLQLGRQTSTGFYHLTGGSISVGDQMFIGGGNSQTGGVG